MDKLWSDDDPEEFLLDLGFGCDEPDFSARIPVRFLNCRSLARGITLQVFLEAQKTRLDLDDPDVGSRFRQIEVLQQVTTALSCLVASSSPGAPGKQLPPDVRERRRRMGMLLRRASKMSLGQIHNEKSHDPAVPGPNSARPAGPDVTCTRPEPGPLENQDHGGNQGPQFQAVLVCEVVQEEELGWMGHGSQRDGYQATTARILQKTTSHRMEEGGLGQAAKTTINQTRGTPGTFPSPSFSSSSRPTSIDDELPPTSSHPLPSPGSGPSLGPRYSPGSGPSPCPKPSVPPGPSGPPHAPKPSVPPGPSPPSGPPHAPKPSIPPGPSPPSGPSPCPKPSIPPEPSSPSGPPLAPKPSIPPGPSPPPGTSPGAGPSRPQSDLSRTLLDIETSEISERPSWPCSVASSSSVHETLSDSRSGSRDDKNYLCGGSGELDCSEDSQLMEACFSSEPSVQQRQVVWYPQDLDNLTNDGSITQQVRARGQVRCQIRGQDWCLDVDRDLVGVSPQQGTHDITVPPIDHVDLDSDEAVLRDVGVKQGSVNEVDHHFVQNQPSGCVSGTVYEGVSNQGGLLRTFSDEQSVKTKHVRTSAAQRRPRLGSLVFNDWVLRVRRRPAVKPAHVMTESLDLVVGTSVDGSDDEHEDKDFIRQLDTERQVYWAEPVQVSPAPDELTEGPGSSSPMSSWTSSDESASKNNPLAPQAPLLFVTPNISSPVSVQVSQSSHIVQRKDVPYWTDPKHPCLPSSLVLDTSSPFRAVQSWTNLQIQQRTLAQKLPPRTLYPPKDRSLSATDMRHLPMVVFHSASSLPLLSSTWRLHQSIPKMVGDLEEVSGNARLVPDVGGTVNRCKDQDEFWKTNHLPMNVCCCCSRRCSQKDYENPNGELQTSLVSPGELQEVMSCLQQFRSSFRNLEEQFSGDQEAVYSVLCDDDRQNVEDIEELRRAVKLEVAELQKMLKELVHHHDNSLKMKMQRLLDEQLQLHSEVFRTSRTEQ